MLNSKCLLVTIWVDNSYSPDGLVQAQVTLPLEFLLTSHKHYIKFDCNLPLYTVDNVTRLHCQYCDLWLCKCHIIKMCTKMIIHWNWSILLYLCIILKYSNFEHALYFTVLKGILMILWLYIVLYTIIFIT